MHDEPSAAKTLDAIRSGGGNLLLSIRARVNEASRALDDGDFVRAQAILAEASQHIVPLAQAQQYLAIADTARLMRVRDLEVGMIVTNLGEVRHVHFEEHGDSCGHYLIRVGDDEDAQPLVLDGDQSVYIEVGEPANG